MTGPVYRTYVAINRDFLDFYSMIYESLLSNIRKHVVLTAQEEDLFASLFQEKKLKKKQFLLHEGQVNQQSTFVVSGCLRAYSVNANGFEHILQFAPADWWIADMYSYVTGKPATLNIDAVEDSTVLMITREDQERAFDEIPKLERYFRILMENSLVANRQRIIDNLSLTATQRFANFCKTYPNLINVIPQKQVAAYIGVTPEFLSKMRSEYFRSLK